MKVEKLVAASGLVLALIISQGAAAQSRSATARAAEEAIADPNRTPFSGSIGLSTVAGSGTFIADKYSDRPYVAQGLSLGASYRVDALPFLAFLSLRQSFSWEYTKPSDATGRKWDYSDLGIGLQAPNIWRHEATGLALTTSLGASLPTSLASIQQDKYTTISGSLTLGMPVAGVYVYGGLSASKNFYKYTNNVLTQDEVRFGNEFGAYCRSGEVYCSGGPFLPNWGLGANLGASYTIIERLSVNANMGWYTGWSYSPPEPDEFTSPLLENPTRTRGADLVSVGAGLAYNYSKLISVSAGVSTSQPWLTADQKGVRNPLYTKYRANNTTRVSLGLSAGF